MTYEFERPSSFTNETVILECVSGSHAYGLNLPTSDIDIRGVYYCPIKDILLGEHKGGISDEKSDISYTELFKFINLLGKNSPAAMELMFITNPEHLLYKHPILEQITLEDVLSKNCFNTYYGYANSQLKRARGANKKAMNPVDKVRKDLIDFAWVFEGQHTIPFRKWISDTNIDLTSLSLCKMANAENMYILYNYPSPSGPISKDNVNLVSVPKDAHICAYLCVNFPAFSSHCHEYKEYWEWIANRNEARYNLNEKVANGRLYYDTKNMMHLFRLLYTAEDIFEKGEFNVWCGDKREHLLAIRNGKYTYEELLEMCDKKLDKLHTLYDNSKLPQTANIKKLKSICLDFYDLNK